MEGRIGTTKAEKIGRENWKRGHSSSRYTEAQVDAALILMAQFGAASTVCKLLAADEPENFSTLAPDTVNAWVRDHPERYQAHRREIAPRLKEQAIAQAERLTIAQGEVEMRAVQRVDATIDEAPAHHAAQAVRNLSSAKSNNIHASRLLRDQPTQIHGKPDAEEIWSQLRRLAPQAFVDGSAEELVDPGAGDPQHAGEITGGDPGLVSDPDAVSAPFRVQPTEDAA